MLPVLAAALAFTTASALAGAQPKPAAAPPAASSQEVLGTVLGLDDDELILDLGTDQGAAEGMVVQIWRPLKLKHPVSGKVLTDRFLIGELKLGQVRKTMSLATPEGALRRDPERGDVVIMARAPAAPAVTPGQPEGPAPGPGEPARPSTKEHLEAQAVAKMFDSLQGADLVTRIRKYEDYVRAQPNGRFARVLYEEAAALRQLLAGERAPGAEPREEERPRPVIVEEPALVSFLGPEEAVAGSPIRFGLEVTDATAGAVLHLRQAGEPAYESVPMTEAGAGYFVATVPGERLAPPEVEYFIEGTSAQGKAYSLVGNASQPRSMEVHAVPLPAPPTKAQASVVLLTDYADYNRFRGNDRVWQTEGFFGMRYGDTGVRAVRMGFGVYRGIGGSIRELDELNLEGRSVGLTYGYLEGEFGIVRAFSLGGRLAVGLLEDGVSGGGQLLLRIGSDQGTNLLLGGEILGGVGLRSMVQLELASFERVPILIRTEVTNQPAGASPSREQSDEEGTAQGGGEVGVRGIVQVGYRVVPSLVLAVRGSFQGRTIRHAGPGFGAAVGYTW